MDLITDEFVFARTGEPLETRLKNSGAFRQQMESLRKASKAFTRDSVKSDECWKVPLFFNLVSKGSPVRAKTNSSVIKSMLLPPLY